jgi:sugar-specific transcriptional regulator TrmB
LVSWLVETLSGKEEHVETLVKLGLTSLQARIYLTILTLQRANVGKVSNIAEIARPDVYRVLPTLEKIGLVRKVITTPIMYEATPLKEGCQILLNRKKAEYEEAEQESTELIRTFEEKNSTIVDQGNGESFWLINGRELLIERILLADSTAKKSIDVIGRWGAIRQVVFSNSDVYQQAMKRGVKIRFITDKPTVADTFVEKLSKANNRLFEFRYLEEPLPIRGAIYDEESANMCVRTIQDQQLTPSLWSNNPEFVKLLVNHFENLWQRAKKRSGE